MPGRHICFDQVRQTFFYVFLLLYLENDGWRSELWRNYIQTWVEQYSNGIIEIVLNGFERFSVFIRLSV